MKILFADDDVQFSAAMQLELVRCGFNVADVCARMRAVIACVRPMPKTALTVRQKEVLDLVAKGCPNKHIARELNIAERTVKMHISSLLELVEAKNRTHLLVLAGERGLL